MSPTKPLLPIPPTLRVMVIFSLHALMVGALFSRIAEIQRALGLSEGELGIALIGVPAGVFTGSLLVSRAVERFGTKAILTLFLPAFSLGPVAAALAPGQATLFGALYFFGATLAICNVCQNVEADRMEAATGRRLINRCHGSWGLGFLISSLIGTGVVAAGMTPLTHFLLLFSVICAATGLVILPMEPKPPRAHRGAARKVRFALPTMGTMLVLGFAISGIWQEGSVRNWSVIYLRDSYGIADWLATVALPAFVAMQTAGRFLADPLIGRMGPVRFGAMLSAISFAGLALVVLANSVGLSLVGFALIGFGISSAHPQALSAVAKLGDRPSSENVAAFSTIQTVMSFAVPPAFGLVAGTYGMQVAFAILMPLPLMAIFFARYLAPQPEEPAAAGE